MIVFYARNIYDIARFGRIGTIYYAHISSFKINAGINGFYSSFGLISTSRQIFAGPQSNFAILSPGRWTARTATDVGGQAPQTARRFRRDV